MALVFNYATHIIEITSPQVLLLCQDLANAIFEEEGTPWGICQPDNDDPGIADMIGKKDKGGSVFSEIIIELYSPWQVQFWGGSGVSTIRGGSLLGGLGGIPVKATGTAGDITLLNQPVDGVLVQSAVSGLTSEESDALLNIEIDVAAMQSSIVGIEGDIAYLQTNVGVLTADVATAVKIVKNKSILDPDTGILTIYDDDNVTPFLIANVYESKDLSQPYRGQGVQRQEKLTTP
jgi:hypothetical protein